MKKGILTAVAVLGVLVGYPICSEFYYAHRISPRGLSSARDFFDRFGAPRSVRVVQHGGQSYYEFTGPLPSAWLLAFPSSAPVYVFDEHGRYVTWCSDPGDAPSFRSEWPVSNTNTVEVGLVRQRLGL